MSNKELENLIEEFLDNQPDNDKDEWYLTTREVSQAVMDDFRNFLKSKGKDAPVFSCCFINATGQKKINVETKDTFKVIYSDGIVSDDWIFS